MAYDWPSRLTGKMRQAYIEMVKDGVWRSHYSQRHLREYIRHKEEQQRRQRLKTFGPVRHESFFGRGEHIDRLSMAKRMADRQDMVNSFLPTLGLSKRRRHLLDGTILTYRKGLFDDTGKITASVGKAREVRYTPWERYIAENIHVMDSTEAMSQIQPALLVWADPQVGHHGSQPHGMLITNKFGPPYYYLPRIVKRGAEETEIFTIQSESYDRGGGWIYEFNRNIQKIVMRSYKTGPTDKYYVMLIMRPCYRDSCGEFDSEFDDAVYNYHGQPEESNGMQELIAYHFAPGYLYTYYNCPTDDYIDLDGYRYAHNHQGNDWVGKYQQPPFYYWREDIWNMGWSTKSRVFFEGDFGRLLVDEDESVFDAAYHAINKINLFLVGYDYNFACVDLLTRDWRPPQFTIEWLLNFAGGAGTWPYPFYAGQIGGGIYAAQTTAFTVNVWQRNKYPDQYAYGDSGEGPYKFPFNIPYGYHARQDFNNMHCPIPVAREWYHEGADIWDGIGQILRASNGDDTEEYAALIVRSQMGGYYWDNFWLTNSMNEMVAKNSRGYLHNFGAAGASIFNSVGLMFSAAMWDCRTPLRADSVDELFGVQVFEVQLNDGSYVTDVSYPGPWSGTVPTWGHGVWGGGRIGSVPMSGTPYVITGKDRHEIAFIVVGEDNMPSLNPNAPEMEIESGGEDSVCWRRIIAPDMEILIGTGYSQRRYAYYSFEEEKKSAGAWPPPVAIPGINRFDPDNGFPKNGHFRNGVVPIKIIHRPSSGARYVQLPGRIEDTHWVESHISDEI